MQSIVVWWVSKFGSAGAPGWRLPGASRLGGARPLSFHGPWSCQPLRVLDDATAELCCVFNRRIAFPADTIHSAVAIRRAFVLISSPPFLSLCSAIVGRFAGGGSVLQSMSVGDCFHVGTVFEGARGALSSLVGNHLARHVG
jgi:hypothetical protein